MYLLCLRGGPTRCSHPGLKCLSNLMLRARLQTTCFFPDISVTESSNEAWKTNSTCEVPGEGVEGRIGLLYPHLPSGEFV